MVKNGQNGQNGLKWFQMVPNDPKRSKMVKISFLAACQSHDVFGSEGHS